WQAPPALKDRFLFSLGRSHSKTSRDSSRSGGCVPLGSTPVEDTQPGVERAFLVGIDVRSRGRSADATGAKITAGAQASRTAASMAAPVAGTSAAKTNKPGIPEFDADESLAELHTLAESAGAKVVGEILQRRDRPDPATLIGAGKLEEIA